MSTCPKRGIFVSRVTCFNIPTPCQVSNLLTIHWLSRKSAVAHSASRTVSSRLKAHMPDPDGRPIYVAALCRGTKASLKIGHVQKCQIVTSASIDLNIGMEIMNTLASMLAAGTVQEGELYPTRNAELSKLGLEASASGCSKKRTESLKRPAASLPQGKNKKRAGLPSCHAPGDGKTQKM